MVSSTPRKAPARAEEIEQARVIKWSHRVPVRTILPALKWLHHSPNGGKRDGFTGAQMKALGTKAGFPDLILPVRSGSCPGLVIEMKSAKGTTSPAQEEWLDHLASEGWATAVARTAEGARSILCEYLGQHPSTVPPLE